jgi:hypothetical protein
MKTELANYLNEEADKLKAEQKLHRSETEKELEDALLNLGTSSYETVRKEWDKAIRELDELGGIKPTPTPTPTPAPKPNTKRPRRTGGTGKTGAGEPIYPSQPVSPQNQ